MSLSNDLLELLESWAELNLTAGDHGNLSSVEMLRCSGAISHATLLHFLSVLLVLIFLSGAAANTLLLCALRGEERGGRLYVVQLAAADLSVLATLPVWVASLQRGGRWPFGERLCQLTHFIFSVNLFSSIFFLTCMSADHFLSAGRRRRRLACAAVWLLALAASVPDSYFLRAVSSGDGAVCRPVFPPRSARFWAAALQLSFVLLGFVLPLLVIAASSLLQPSGAQLERRSGRRAVRAYAAALVACWLPYHAVLLLDTVTLLGLLTFSCRLEDFLNVALHLTQVSSLLHCVVNPALYLMLRPQRRDIISDVFLRYSAKTGLARLGHASDSQLELTAEHV
ncbi:uncharacterized protein LOC128354569 [Scomber scombrus]|uniref:Uncharacterized protein LOC128354569 n=1 Tax=Scomber scombrus TaxID=13677 RepID=A0AAV1QDY1_SCOSC